MITFKLLHINVFQSILYTYVHTYVFKCFTLGIYCKDVNCTTVDPSNPAPSITDTPLTWTHTTETK